MLAPMPPVRDMANQVQNGYLGLASSPPIRMLPTLLTISATHSRNKAKTIH